MSNSGNKFQESFDNYGDLSIDDILSSIKDMVEKNEAKVAKKSAADILSQKVNLDPKGEFLERASNDDIGNPKSENDMLSNSDQSEKDKVVKFDEIMAYVRSAIVSDAEDKIEEKIEEKLERVDHPQKEEANNAIDQISKNGENDLKDKGNEHSSGIKMMSLSSVIGKSDPENNREKIETTPAKNQKNYSVDPSGEKQGVNLEKLIAVLGNCQSEYNKASQAITSFFPDTQKETEESSLKADQLIKNVIPQSLIYALLKDLLQPAIKIWLDKNLYSVVKEVAEQELMRIKRG